MNDLVIDRINDKESIHTRKKQLIPYKTSQKTYFTTHLHMHYLSNTIHVIIFLYLSNNGHEYLKKYIYLFKICQNRLNNNYVYNILLKLKTIVFFV